MVNPARLSKVSLHHKAVEKLTEEPCAQTGPGKAPHGAPTQPAHPSHYGPRLRRHHGGLGVSERQVKADYGGVGPLKCDLGASNPELTHQLFKHCFLMGQKMVNNGLPTGY